jgi:hypothetical protein
MSPEELNERLQEAMAAFQQVVSEAKPAEMWRGMDELTVEQFWQSWPEARAWGEFLYQLIAKERGEKATPAKDQDEEYDEIGGGG